MNFRVIRKQIASPPVFGSLRRSRVLGLGAAVATLLGTAVLAQTASDFIDPLSDERIRVERQSDAPSTSPEAREKPARPDAMSDEKGPATLLTQARNGAQSGATVAQERATGFWARMRNAVSDVADSLGLPTSGLLGILGLLVAGLAALVGWTLFRSRRKPRVNKREVDVYARSRSAGTRRLPGDETPFVKSARTEPDFEETMPEDFDSIFEEERTSTPEPPKTMDTSTWRKPNLDKLRNSIKADWKSDKIRSGEGTESLAPVTATAPATHSDPSERSLNDISDGWEEWDEQVKPEDDPWGEALETGGDVPEKDAAAIQRIRALRESLRAS